MEEPIISVSGLRGIIGVSLSPQTVMNYVAAFARVAPPGPIVVSGDGRTTGPMLADVVHSTLRALGRTSLDAGVAATPTTGVMVRTLQAAGGIQISASHNPPAYNGLKLFDAGGRVIPAQAGQQVIEHYRKQAPAWATFDKVGRRENVEEAQQAHLRLVFSTVEVDRIRARRFRVLLDANHGAGSRLGRPLLEALGCEVTVLGETPDGLFEHPPEPTADNLQQVLQQVTQHQADIGFCQDPDADRLAVIDEAGRYVGEEYTLALCLNHALPTRPGPIVVNCASSRMALDLAEKYGVPCHLAAVGEANVVDLMLKEQAVLGGEGNGGVIDPRVGWVRDSLAGMAQILDAMSQRQRPVSALVDELPRYYIHKTTAALPASQLQAAYRVLQTHWPDAQFSLQDGLRITWANRWLLVRPSNTEPIVRLIVESPENALSLQMLAEARQQLASFDSK